MRPDHDWGAVTLKLTAKQAAKLSEVLWGHSDEGPFDEGWASNELGELRRLMDTALDATFGGAWRGKP